MNLSDKATASVRTGWNIGILSALTALIYKMTGWTITVDELLPYAPVIAVVGGIFYRACRALAEKFPWLARILFGNTSVPNGYQPPVK